MFSRSRIRPSSWMSSLRDSNKMLFACRRPETKCGEVALQSGNYLRFHSDGEKHWGVAIWISRKRPLLWLGGSPRYVDMDDVTTIAAGPRLLLLKVVVQSTQIVIGSLHFPHQARPLAEQQQFRQQVLELLDPWRQLTCLLGCDTKARPDNGFHWRSSF